MLSLSGDLKGGVTMSTFFFPQGGHCGEVQPYLKIPGIPFSFSGCREEQRFVLNRVGADLQVFISGSNNRGTADIKDIMTKGKRSQVGRLVCEPLLVIPYLVIYRILEKDYFSSVNDCRHWLESHLHATGLWLRFQVGGYEISWRGITCSL